MPPPRETNAQSAVNEEPMNPTEPCPCGTGRCLAQCCGRFLDSLADAPTAETLMRSRYSAWVLGRLDYLRATWHPDTCPADLTHDPATRWLGLQVLGTAQGGVADSTGTVEFVARWQTGGRATRLHEVSEFVRWQGRWVYRAGSPPARRERRPARPR